MAAVAGKLFYDYWMAYYVIMFLLMTGIAARFFWFEISTRRYLAMTLISTILLGVGAIPAGHAPPVVFPLWIWVLYLPTFIDQKLFDASTLQFLGYTTGISILIVATGTGLLAGIVAVVRRIHG